MFITNLERLQLRKDIESLTKIISRMNVDLLQVSARVKKLEPKKVLAKKKLTAEQRKKQREYARRYNAKKRMEKANANSISAASI